MWKVQNGHIKIISFAVVAKLKTSMGRRGPNSGQFSYPLPNMVHPLESSVRTGAGNCPEFVRG